MKDSTPASSGTVERERPGVLGKSPELDRVVQFYESIQPGSLGELGQIYAAEARFKDPFNEVQGLSAIARIFAHMFEQVSEPRFTVREVLRDGAGALLIWDFDFCFKAPLAGRQVRVRGCTHLRFDASGLIDLHRDYWDTAEELYERIPILGSLMRHLRQRGRAG